MKISQTCEELSKVSKLSESTSKKINEVKKSKSKLEKTICFEARSIRKSRRSLTKDFCCASSSTFWSSTSIMNCCSFSTKSICLNNRCCFAKISQSSIFNFFRLFSKRRQRVVFNETRSHETAARIHSMHLFEDSSTRQVLKIREQLRQERMMTTSESTNFNKIARRKKEKDFFN